MHPIIRSLWDRRCLLPPWSSGPSHGLPIRRSWLFLNSWWSDIPKITYLQMWKYIHPVPSSSAVSLHLLDPLRRPAPLETLVYTVLLAPHFNLCTTRSNHSLGRQYSIFMAFCRRRATQSDERSERHSMQSKMKWQWQADWRFYWHLWQCVSFSQRFLSYSQLTV